MQFRSYSEAPLNRYFAGNRADIGCAPGQIVIAYDRSVQPDRPLFDDGEPVRHAGREFVENVLHIASEHARCRAGHADVGLARGSAGQHEGVGGRHVRMGAENGGDPPVEQIPHRELFACRLGMEVDKDAFHRFRQLFGENPLNRFERVVGRFAHEHLALQVDDSDFAAGRIPVDAPAAAGLSLLQVGRAQDAVEPVDFGIEAALVPDVVAAGQHIGALEQFPGAPRGQAGARRRIFGIHDDELTVEFPAQFGDQEPDGFASSLADDVADEQQIHDVFSSLPLNGHGAAAAPLPENEQHGQRGRETGRRKVHCRFEHEIFAGHARQQQHDSGDAPAAADDHAHPCAECERSLRRAGQHDELRESGADQHSGERREAGGPAAAGQREIEHEQRNAGGDLKFQAGKHPVALDEEARAERAESGSEAEKRAGKSAEAEREAEFFHVTRQQPLHDSAPGIDEHREKKEFAEGQRGDRHGRDRLRRTVCRCGVRLRRIVECEPDPRPVEEPEQQADRDQQEIEPGKAELFDQHSADQRPRGISGETGEHEKRGRHRRSDRPLRNGADAAQPLRMGERDSGAEHEDQHDQECERSRLRRESGEADRAGEEKPELDQLRPLRGFAQRSGPELDAVRAEAAERQEHRSGDEGERILLTQRRQEARQRSRQHIDREVDRGEQRQPPERERVTSHGLPVLM